MPYAVAAAAVAAGGAIYASDQASTAQNKATDKAIEAQKAFANSSKADLAPYRDAGAAALDRLRTLMGLAPGNASKDYTGSLVDMSSGTPAPVQRLYATDPAYKAAWDNYAAQHLQHFGKGYTPDSNASVIEQAVRAQLPDQAAQPDSSAGSGDSELLRKFNADDLAADPVYNSGLQFGLDEGTKAVERRASASGGYDSGATLKALTRFANDYGSTKAADSRSRFVEDQGNVYGKLSALAGMGSGATSIGVGAGASTASNLSGLISGQGNANAAAAIAGGNALAGGANSVGNYFQQQQLLAQLSGGGQRTTPSYTGTMDSNQ